MKHNRMISAALLFAALAIGAGCSTTQRTASHERTPVASDSASAAEATITMDTARATALAKVPGGTIESAELERERGRLIYSFDIKVTGKSGIDEVNVDAMDGSVVSFEHEGPGAEQKEARQDSLEKATPR